MHANRDASQLLPPDGEVRFPAGAAYFFLFLEAARVNARSIFSIVATLGVCLPVSIRQRCSKLIPARLASSRCDNPAAARSRMIFLAKLARA